MHETAMRLFPDSPYADAAFDSPYANAHSG
jgi:hypothetical protein